MSPSPFCSPLVPSLNRDKWVLPSCGCHPSQQMTMRVSAWPPSCQIIEKHSSLFIAILYLLGKNLSIKEQRGWKVVKTKPGFLSTSNCFLVFLCRKRKCWGWLVSFGLNSKAYNVTVCIIPWKNVLGTTNLRLWGQFKDKFSQVIRLYSWSWKLFTDIARVSPSGFWLVSWQESVWHLEKHVCSLCVALWCKNNKNWPPWIFFCSFSV